MYMKKFFHGKSKFSYKSVTTRKWVVLGLMTSFLLSTLVSIWSLNIMAKDNTRAMDMILTARIFDTLNNKVSEPVNVAETMSATKQLKDMLKEEDNQDANVTEMQLQEYLQGIKNTFQYETAFVVSDKSKNYYTYYGLMKKIDTANNTNDNWYSEVVTTAQPYDVSVDKDSLMPDKWTVFVNAKIEDDTGHLLGVCGVGMELTDLQKLFHKMEDEYNVKINLIDNNGIIKVATSDSAIDKPYDGILDTTDDNGDGYIYTKQDDGEFTITKHLENIDLYLVVTSKDMVGNHELWKVIVFNTVLSSLIMLFGFMILRLIVKKADAHETEAFLLTKRMTAAAQIYFDFREINIINNTVDYDINYDEDSSDQDALSNAQEKLYDFIADNVIPEQQEQINKFIDFSTLDERLEGRNTITSEFMTKDGKWLRVRFVICQYTPLGKIATVLWLVVNVTEERKSRKALMEISARATAANEAKSAFLSNMSHEIRTPINAILGMNEMIIRESGEHNIIDYADNIRIAGKNLLSIINNILDFSKIEAGKMEIIPAEYDLSVGISILINMIKARAEEKGLTLTLDIDENIPKFLVGDDMRIKQVVTNLLTNAVKYTSTGGIVFTVGFEKLDEEYILMKVSVKDTGQGIKKADMSKLFADFERINEGENRYVEGTGLGLSISKRLLEMMGAELEVESVYKLGSHFHFAIRQKVTSWEPLGDYTQSYKASLYQERQAEKAKLYAPDATILVVDDNHMNVTVFRNLLKRTGIQVDTAYSGNEALAMVYDKQYDIIFLDHMMPQKDGIATLHEMKELKNSPNINTPVVCLTANAISGAKEKYLAEGFNDYLTKPIDTLNMENMLIEYLPEAKVTLLNQEDMTSEPGVQTVESQSILPEFLLQIDEIDLKAGTVNNGDEESYLEALKIYASMADKYVTEISQFMDNGDVENATIKIHALKSTSRIIGAAAIGDLAQHLEDAGKTGDTDTLNDELEGLLERCRKLGELLCPLLNDDSIEKDESLPIISEEAINEIYGKIKEFADSCDSFGIEETLDELKQYRMAEEDTQRINDIKKGVDDFDFAKVSELCNREV
ncbi:MAG: response regulator [Anaerovibrio sp.]|uniref:hybrid sensor histidine kinase/response regulator n=1 Tax=Anaerovibrio sp. TaxID=1872532 RepID=UPI0025D3CA4F|nr:hybrid sensor histidine kinase/response regulator [Anaerovibrio sp.]MCR5177186.1 response regulator [Anaerovibrio sp.]